MTADLDKVYERFKNLLELKNKRYQEFISTRFDEYDLKEIIYLLGELKAIREKEPK
jgi:hypothetical protein